MFGGGGNEGQHLFLHADDHTVQEGADRAAQHHPLDGAAQCWQEVLQTVPVDLGAAALLHRLLVAERFAGPTKHTTTASAEQEKNYVARQHLFDPGLSLSPHME